MIAYLYSRHTIVLLSAQLYVLFPCAFNVPLLECIFLIEIIPSLGSIPIKQTNLLCNMKKIKICERYCLQLLFYV